MCWLFVFHASVIKDTYLEQQQSLRCSKIMCNEYIGSVTLDAAFREVSTQPQSCLNTPTCLSEGPSAEMEVEGT